MDIKTILSEREKTHGDFKIHSGCSQELKGIIIKWMGLANKDWNDIPNYTRESINMICHKLGRIAAGDHDFCDHWDDIAGYAILTAICCSK